MEASEWQLSQELRSAGSDKEAFDLFFHNCQERIYQPGVTLLAAYHQSAIREPWKTIAYAHQIWGSIGHNGIYGYLEDESAQDFDLVVEAALKLIGLDGFEVIADYRRRVAEDPEFWKREWHDHVFIYRPRTAPELPPSEEAEEVWRKYRDLFGRFWDATRNFEAKAGAFLRTESLQVSQSAETHSDQPIQKT